MDKILHTGRGNIFKLFQSYKKVDKSVRYLPFEDLCYRVNSYI